MGKKKFFLFIIGSFLLLLIPVYIFISVLQIGKAPKTKPPIIPIPSDFKRDYSRINSLTPGKSTYENVLETLGSPLTENDNKTQRVLYYPTPNQDFNNVVVLENDVISFAVEHVYSSYRGNYSDYLKKYGQPELMLYSKESYSEGYDWFIFLSKGIGVESSNNEITQVVYFIPQNKNSFISNIGAFLGLSQIKPTPEGELLIDPGL